LKFRRHDLDAAAAAAAAAAAVPPPPSRIGGGTDTATSIFQCPVRRMPPFLSLSFSLLLSLAFSFARSLVRGIS